jgi:AraC-like DNA-binding protein
LATRYFLSLFLLSTGKDTKTKRPTKTSSAAAVPVNPPESVLGTENAILTGTNRRYYVPDYEGCLSVKTVVCGSALWEAAGRQFIVHENSYLILNDRQRYTITIDSARKVTTFCIFFKRGLVEDVFRSRATPTTILLDFPVAPASDQLHFPEKLETQGHGVLGLIRELRRRMAQGIISRQALEVNFYMLAAAMVRDHQQVQAAAANLPALRSSTRQELYRRLLRGRDYLLSSLDRPVLLSDMAREACLSPYHFHRAFTQAFHETPHRYLTRQRLEKARHLLSQRERSVTEVCFECGFQSLGSFSSLFRRHFGISPSEFRHGQN